MPHTLISEYLQYPCPYVLDSVDWLELAYAYNKLDDTSRTNLLKAIAAHSGVPLNQINQAIPLLAQERLTPDARELILSELNLDQCTATNNIELFQQRTWVKTINSDALNITRAEWLILIEKFTKQQGHNLTSVFFLSQLSITRKVGYDVLTKQISRTQPQRAAKKIYESEEAPSIKRRKQDYLEDGNVNPLILSAEDGDEALHTKLLNKGVRITSLEPATPTPNNPRAARTPGKTLVRALCLIGENTFFKPVTPQGDRASRGRVQVQNASKDNLVAALPKFQFMQPGPIEFIATLESINERAGVERRQGQKSIKKVTCADIFRAYGIKIKASDGRHHHWSHVIAYFLGGDQDAMNLIPSTSAANYNTLEAIELFIEKKLKSTITDEIKISVVPHYNNEEVIPDLLTYSLEWTENNKIAKEVFYIHPQSYQRITKSMHQSIDILREENSENREPISFEF